MPLFRKFVGFFKSAGVAIRKRLLGGLPAVYVEDVFSNYLYTTTGSDQTITNNIDLSTYGGLVWVKGRSAIKDNVLVDTVRGVSKSIVTNTSNSEDYSSGNYVKAFSTTGFTVSGIGAVGSSGTFGTWTFRKQAKFFDVVTYTGTQNYGGGGQTVSHNLGSTPGCIIIKPLSDTSGSGFTLNNWIVYHRGLSSPTSQHLKLNTTASIDGNNDKVKAVSSTTFTAGWEVGLNGIQYVAYIFAHDAGGFGLTGTDNVISCGSYTGAGSPYTGGSEVTLGYEPQWLLIKRADTGTANWVILDNMRGLTADGTNENWLYPNLSDAEGTSGTLCKITATGFKPYGSSLTNDTGTYIYIAIRRGPMKVPTSGTSVFSPQVQTPTGATNYVMAGSSGFPVDWLPTKQKDNVVDWYQTSRLTNNYMSPNTTAAEAAYTYGFDFMQGVSAQWNTNSTVSYAFRRAPSFFDVVCATPSYPTPITHNLGAVPKLRIEKTRNYIAEWKVLYYDGTTDEYELALNSTRAAQLQSGRPALPTSTSFVAYYDTVPIVVYLFAPVTGVQYISKFTGNGSSQTINCGFTGGARFICIKAFSTTGDWKVIDTARGIISGNDSTLAFNTTSAEVTGTDCIDPDSSGFIVNQESTNNLNVNGVEYLVWAIA